MAKIYETRDDLKREELTKQARDEKASQSYDSTAALMAFGIGGTSLHLDTLEQFRADTLKQNRTGFFKYADKVLGWAGIVVGVVALTAYFFSRKKAKEAETQLEQLGPQQVVLPNDVQPGDPVPEGRYVARLQKAAQETTAACTKSL